MNFSKLFTLALFLPVLALADHVEFKGEFSQIHASDAPCAAFFNQKEYVAKFFLTGPTNHTAVLYLESTAEGGGFHRVNQVGLFGASNDFNVDKKYKDGENSIELAAEGIVDYQFIMFKQTVKVLSADNKVLCSGEGEFSGFH